MEPKLKELLVTIDSRFSGPESCRLNDMILGRLSIDYDEIETYLTNLVEFGGIEDSEIILKNQKDAKVYLEKYKEYRVERNKKAALL